GPPDSRLARSRSLRASEGRDGAFAGGAGRAGRLPGIRAPFELLLAQGPLEDLLQRVLGQRLHDLDVARALVRIELGAAELHQLAFVELDALARDDEGLDDLVAVLVGHADDGGLLDAGMLEQDGL